jgi:hypothetical protein
MKKKIEIEKIDSLQKLSSKVEQNTFNDIQTNFFDIDNDDNYFLKIDNLLDKNKSENKIINVCNNKTIKISELFEEQKKIIKQEHFEIKKTEICKSINLNDTTTNIQPLDEEETSWKTITKQKKHSTLIINNTQIITKELIKSEQETNWRNPISSSENKIKKITKKIEKIENWRK